MCSEWTTTYGCGHWRKKVKPCTTHHKQQHSFRNLIFGSYRRQENCGVVRPMRRSIHGDCATCGLRPNVPQAQRSEDGPTFVHRQTFDESCQRYNARHGLSNLERSQGSTRNHHQIASTKNPGSTPGHYYGQTDSSAASYARDGQAAPPSAPLRPARPRNGSSGKSRRPSSRKADEKDKGKVRTVTRRSENSADAPGTLSVRADRQSAFQTSSQPPRRPTKPTSTFGSGPRIPGPQGPPAPSTSRGLPSQARPVPLGYSAYIPSASSIPAERYGAHVPVTGKVPHHLRRDLGRVQRSRPPPPRPEPLYQEYLSAHQAMLAQRRVQGSTPASAPLQPPVQPMIRRFDEDSSDLSFTCHTSRAIEGWKYA